MSSSHTIREFGTIHRKADFPAAKDSFNEIYIEDMAFDSLRNFIAENVDDNSEVDNAFSVHRKKAKDYIRVKNYVGVVETRDHTSIEILPKIFFNESANEKQETRKIFLRMLRHLKGSPFKSIDNAQLKTAKFPILEVFIQTFLAELEVLILRGIRKHYVNQNENENFLKGSLDFSKQIQHNLIHKERFFVNYDEFSVDIPQNRIIKSCLVYLLKKTRSPKNKIRIYNHLGFLEDISESRNLTIDFIAIKDANRLFTHYDQVLQWAKVFLQGESFTNFKGSNLNKAILFPMERIFEDYVGHGFKKYWTGYEVSLQDRGKSLVDRHRDATKFNLRPDIVIRNIKKELVLDTKWKIIDQENTRKNYGISQSDMYQLFAYGKKYDRREGITPELVLLYPQNKGFTEPLSRFEYEEKLHLKVIPVKLDCPLEETIDGISAFLILS